MVIALKKIMDEKGLTAIELAEKTGLSKSAIWNYSSGRNAPDPETLCRLADALDVSLDMLVRGKEKDHSEEWSKGQMVKMLESLPSKELQEMLVLSTFLRWRKEGQETEGQGKEGTE